MFHQHTSIQCLLHVLTWTHAHEALLESKILLIKCIQCTRHGAKHFRYILLIFITIDFTVSLNIKQSGLPKVTRVATGRGKIASFLQGTFAHCMCRHSPGIHHQRNQALISAVSEQALEGRKPILDQ